MPLPTKKQHQQRRKQGQKLCRQKTTTPPPSQMVCPLDDHFNQTRIALRMTRVFWAPLLGPN